MNKKSSAHYQREFRRRLRDKGLIKKEIWILPENTSQLTAIEQQLRHSQNCQEATPTITGGCMEKTPVWTTPQIFDALNHSGLVESGRAKLEIIDGSEPAILIEMKEYGDLPIFLTVSGEQIIVESILWAQSDVIDINEFNEVVLRTHKYFPLSTISLDKLADKQDYYHMFGALSATSALSNVVFEIDVLASNVIQATEAYSEHLTITLDSSVVTKRQEITE